MKRRIAVLTSGGLDSNVLVGHFLKKGLQVYPIYIRSGYVWEKAEIHWLKKFLTSLRAKNLERLTILEAPMNDILKNHWAMSRRKTPSLTSHDKQVYLPGRNLLLLAKTAVFCAQEKISEIAVGSLSGNPFSDATPTFFKNMSQAASQALGFRIKISAPFLRLKKKDILPMGKDLPLHLSFSCLAPRGIRPCRKCNKCFEYMSLRGTK